MKQPDVVVVASAPFVSGTVRHLRLCCLTSELGSAHGPDSFKRSGWVHESIGSVEPVSLAIEPHGVNVHLPPVPVGQDEVPWDSALDFPKPLALEHAPQTRKIGLPNDEVEVVVWASLLTEQRVNAQPPSSQVPIAERSRQRMICKTSSALIMGPRQVDVSSAKGSSGDKSGRRPSPGGRRRLQEHDPRHGST